MLIGVDMGGQNPISNVLTSNKNKMYIQKNRPWKQTAALFYKVPVTLETSVFNIYIQIIHLTNSMLSKFQTKEIFSDNC